VKTFGADSFVAADLAATAGEKKHLPIRGDLNGSTLAAQMYDTVVAAVIVDLGGFDNISTLELGLIECYAGAKVAANYLHGELKAGAVIDHGFLASHSFVSNTMVKTGARLGLHRRSRPVTTTLGELIKMDQDAMRMKLAHERDTKLTEAENNYGYGWPDDKVIDSEASNG
jgi:hypothetical protein